MAVAIEVEDLSKAYQLGEIGTGTLSRDLERWWAKMRGKEDPFLKIGEANDRTSKGESDVVWSLKDINFQIEQGDAVGIIGRNGAGKSTLLKLLSRITSPTSGSIKVKGRIASLLEVGTGFHPELTGKENIYLNGAILGMRKKEITRKFDEIVDFAGVERYIDTPVKRYSSGMYVRLAFAVAAYLESEILIVDEVLAVGDAEFQRKCLGKMGEVSKGQGRTVLFVSHNLAAVNSFCNKGMLLDKGNILLQGFINEVINNYHLSNNRQIEASKKWDSNECPSNYWCKITSVHLVNFSNEENVNITTDDSFAILINYKSLHQDARIGLTVIVSDMNNNIIFGSINNHEKNYYSKLMPIGEYMSSCIIPRSFFNAGNYALSLIVFGPNFTDALDIKDIFNFEILDGASVRGDFHGTYAGVLRPLLQWETNKIK